MRALSTRSTFDYFATMRSSGFLRTINVTTLLIDLLPFSQTTPPTLSSAVSVTFAEAATSNACFFDAALRVKIRLSKDPPTPSSSKPYRRKAAARRKVISDDEDDDDDGDEDSNDGVRGLLTLFASDVTNSIVWNPNIMDVLLQSRRYVDSGSSYVLKSCWWIW